MLINRQEHLSFSPVHSITLIKMSQSSGRLVVDLTETVERTKREPVRKEKEHIYSQRHNITGLSTSQNSYHNVCQSFINNRSF
jgi:hypothetical protein